MTGYPLTLEAMSSWCERHSVQAEFTTPEAGADPQLVIPRPEGSPLLVIERIGRGMLTFALALEIDTLDEAALQRAHAAIAYLNAHLFMGAWQVNSEAQQIYFRVTVPTDGVIYDDASLRRLVETTIGSFAAGAEPLLGVVRGHAAGTGDGERGADAETGETPPADDSE